MSKKVELTMLEIFEYVGNRHRPLNEGEALFRAGHIILCGIEVGSDKVKSLCLQTSALSSPPHEIEIEFTQCKWSCKCSCKAGNSGFCKHIIGTLIYINRHQELEIISCTDVTQAWGKEKQELSRKYAETTVDIFCHKPKKFKAVNIKTTPEIDFEILNSAINDHPTSALGSFIRRDSKKKQLSRISSSVEHQTEKNDYEVIIENLNKSSVFESIHLDLTTLKSCCQEIIKSLEVKYDKDIIKNYSQGTDEWHSDRKLRVTGSRCYKIYTFSKINEWEQKARSFFWPNHFVSKYTNHGKTFESEALQVFKQTSGMKVVTVGFVICKKMPWLGYSPDGIIFDKDGPSKLLEIKCPYDGKDQPAESFWNDRYLIMIDGSAYLRKRHEYYAHIQLGMFLLNLRSTEFVLYSSFSKTYKQITINFDEEYTKDLVQVSSQKYLYNMLHVYCCNK